MLEDAFEKNESGFARSSCKHVIESNRESTARVAVWREFGVKNSFTLETTFCGFSKGKKKVSSAKKISELS